MINKQKIKAFFKLNNSFIFKKNNKTCKNL